MFFRALGGGHSPSQEGEGDRGTHQYVLKYHPRPLPVSISACGQQQSRLELMQRYTYAGSLEEPNDLRRKQLYVRVAKVLLLHGVRVRPSSNGQSPTDESESNLSARFGIRVLHLV